LAAKCCTKVPSFLKKRRQSNLEKKLPAKSALDIAIKEITNEMAFIDLALQNSDKTFGHYVPDIDREIDAVFLIGSKLL